MLVRLFVDKRSMKTVTNGLLLLGLLSLCLASSDRLTRACGNKLCWTEHRSFQLVLRKLIHAVGRLRHRRALQQDEEHGREERSVTARAEVVRTPAGTPVQKNFSELAFSGQCNFSLSSGASGSLANYKRIREIVACMLSSVCVCAALESLSVSAGIEF